MARNVRESMKTGSIVVFTLLALAAGFVWGVPTDPDPVRIGLAGDSTMCEYAEKRKDRGWGMFLKEAFEPGRVEVGNFAKAGRSTKTFIKQKHWKRAIDWKPDYVFIQFGHNDSHAPGRPESTDASTDFREFLARYIADCRSAGAVPILVTPMVRRTFHEDGTLDDNLGPYAEAMKAVARESGVAVIDLHSSSGALVLELGPDGAPSLANRRGDPTHFNEKGARAMLALVLDELPEACPELAELLKPSSKE